MDSSDEIFVTAFSIDGVIEKFDFFFKLAPFQPAAEERVGESTARFKIGDCPVLLM